MKAKETMICWNPNRRYADDGFPEDKIGKMILVPHPDKSGLSNAYRYTDLACWSGVEKMPAVKLRHLVMSIALGAIMRDGLDPQEVHRALWPLKEYRDALPADVMPPPGAHNPDGENSWR